MGRADWHAELTAVERYERWRRVRRRRQASIFFAVALGVGVGEGVGRITQAWWGIPLIIACAGLVGFACARWGWA